MALVTAGCSADAVRATPQSSGSGLLPALASSERPHELQAQ